MDFFDTIDKYETNLSNNVDYKLQKFLSEIAQLNDQTKQLNHDDSAIFDEILASEKVTQLIICKNNNNKKNKYTIFAKNSKLNQLCNCFNQATIENNSLYFSLKTESQLIKQPIIEKIMEKVKNIYNSSTQLKLDYEPLGTRTRFPWMNNYQLKKKRFDLNVTGNPEQKKGETFRGFELGFRNFCLNNHGESRFHLTKIKPRQRILSSKMRIIQPNVI